MLYKLKYQRVIIIQQTLNKSQLEELRFVIFRTLFGSKRKFVQSLCPHNSFTHLHFDLENSLEI